MEITDDQLSKILSEILKPLLGIFANKVVATIVEKVKQANEAKPQENRVTIRDGYTMFSPLYPIKRDIAQQKTPRFNEVHRLGTKHHSHLDEESQQTYNNYKIEADQHKYNNKPHSNNESVNNHKPHFSLFRK